MSNRSNKIKYNKSIVKILIASFIGISTLICVYWLLGFIDKKDNSQVIENAGESAHAQKKITSISYKEKSIELNPHIKNILLMGIDTFEQTSIEHSDAYYNYQQADFLALVVMNTEQETLSILHINRDTMTDVPWLTMNGKVGGTNYEQIALSHTYGSGREDSCKNTVNTTSNLLFGLPIDNYVSLSMAGLPKLNDAVGGVTVFVEDDFSNIDSSIVKGENIKLVGNQALTYVRSRKGVGSGTNLERMKRQKQYITGFMKSFQNASKDDNFYSHYINVASEYIITDFTSDGLINAMNQLCDFTFTELSSPDGRTILNQNTKYIEFIVDKDNLFMILQKHYLK